MGHCHHDVLGRWVPPLDDYIFFQFALVAEVRRLRAAFLRRPFWRASKEPARSFPLGSEIHGTDGDNLLFRSYSRYIGIVRQLIGLPR